MNITNLPPERQASSQRVADAIDNLTYDEIADLAYRAASYWYSIALAADRGERLTVEVHCRQVAAVTRTAFAAVKLLGSVTREADCAA